MPAREVALRIGGMVGNPPDLVTALSHSTGATSPHLAIASAMSDYVLYLRNSIEHRKQARQTRHGRLRFIKIHASRGVAVAFSIRRIQPVVSDARHRWSSKLWLSFEPTTQCCCVLLIPCFVPPSTVLSF